MLKMIEGCSITSASILNEGYQIFAERIEANVNADKILNLFYDFIDAHLDYFFLILEIPTNLKDEVKEDDTAKTHHKDVYYIDGMTAIEIKALLANIGNLFINDGLAQIGVGAHNNVSEIMTDKYNIVYALGNNISILGEIFAKNGIPEVPQLVTAWQYFTKDNPGESFSITSNNQSVYDVLERLKKETNLYFAERREESM